MARFYRCDRCRRELDDAQAHSFALLFGGPPEPDSTGAISDRNRRGELCAACVTTLSAGVDSVLANRGEPMP